MPSPILEIKDLAISFGRGTIEAVKGLDFSLHAGEVVGLVGESGSGKSMTALSLMGLLPYGAIQNRGQITFKGQLLSSLGSKERRKLCGHHIGMVFQEPLTALNPVLTIGEQLAEIYRHRLNLSKTKAWTNAIEILGRVGLANPETAAESYPHRFSGGMRQRVVIAMALAQAPELVIADEPTTALDPTIAAQIIILLQKMTAEQHSAVLFITHNLRLLTGLAARILVMYAGLIMEETSGINFQNPLHPYTKGLLRALPPSLSNPAAKRLIAIPGHPPGPTEKFPGCPFAPRCHEYLPKCSQTCPPMTELGNNQRVRCFRYGNAKD